MAKTEAMRLGFFQPVDFDWRNHGTRSKTAKDPDYAILCRTRLNAVVENAVAQFPLEWLDLQDGHELNAPILIAPVHRAK